MENQGYTAIAEVGELQPNEMKAFEHEGKRLLLVYADDEYFVVDEMCTHEDYSLALGCIKGRRIKCSLHGSYFDLETGVPDEEPADEPICSYGVQVADGKVWFNPEARRANAQT